MYFLSESLAMVISELRNNKLRTFLSLLGITIGIFCIISVLTVFDSLQQNIQNSMLTLGSKNLYVGKYPWIPEDKGEYPWWKYRARPVCTFAEVLALKRDLHSALEVCICYTDQGKASRTGRETTAGIFAVSADFEKFQSFDIEQGRYFTSADMQNPNMNAVVIGYSVARDLFPPNVSVLNNTLNLYGRQCRIIGILKKHGRTNMGFDFDEGILIPYLYLASFKDIDGNIGNGFVDPMLMVSARKNVTLDDLYFELISTLRAVRKLRPRDPDNFSINKLDALQSKVNELFSKIKISGWIIGFFSLIVGCFGIANIMYVSVKERTGQIGLKKALGARSRIILFDFLMESVILCLIGGFIGIILVFLLSFMLTGLLDFPVFLSANNFILGISISLIVGIIAGYLPARKAAWLNPVAAIRS